MNGFWKVVVIIVVLVVVGFGAYHVYHHYTWTPAPTQPSVTQIQTMKAKPSAMMAPNGVYKMMSNAQLGTILTDPKGMTLYTYAKDTTGVSNCNGGCLQAWPAYVAKSQTGTFPANVSVIKRSEGTLQYAWKGMPLYYYANDAKAGDVTGNGIGGVWAVVK